MTSWFPYTCDCQIHVETKKFLNRCNLHKNTRNTSEVNTHADSFDRISDNDEQRAKRMNDEKERIRGLPRIEIEPLVSKPSIWARIKHSFNR